MKVLLLFCALCLLLVHVFGYWDTGTSTAVFIRTDITPRQSFFRWQCTYTVNWRWFFWYWDWVDIDMRRRLNVIAGISIRFLCLGTASILNKRTLITSANYLDPWLNEQRDLRVWALGRAGVETSPYRYRVWRVTRVFPKSLNPEHWHGPRGIHSPRHDIAIIHTLDMMYVMPSPPSRWHLPYRTFLTTKHHILGTTQWFAGSGYEYLLHIAENYKIFYAYAPRKNIVDCSKYLPKWWGKFICYVNSENVAGVPNGGGLFDFDRIVGLGCFEIRYNEDRIMVFTDIRYYVDHIHRSAWIYFGQYYEYAYPQWGIKQGYTTDGFDNFPYIPWWQVQNDLYPLGKK